MKINIKLSVKKINIKALKKFSGWHIFQSSWKPIMAVVATDMLEYISCGILKEDFARKQKIIFIHIAIAAGTEILIIFENNDFFISETFGSSANKNDGIPTVSELIKLIWIGVNGYGIEKNTKSTVKIAEYIVFTKNKLEVV